MLNYAHLATTVTCDIIVACDIIAVHVPSIATSMLTSQMVQDTLPRSVCHNPRLTAIHEIPVLNSDNKVVGIDTHLKASFDRSPYALLATIFSLANYLIDLATS